MISTLTILNHECSTDCRFVGNLLLCREIWQRRRPACIRLYRRRALRVVGSWGATNPRALSTARAPACCSLCPFSTSLSRAGPTAVGLPPRERRSQSGRITLSVRPSVLSLTVSTLPYTILLHTSSQSDRTNPSDLLTHYTLLTQFKTRASVISHTFYLFVTFYPRRTFYSRTRIRSLPFSHSNIFRTFDLRLPDSQ